MTLGMCERFLQRGLKYPFILPHWWVILFFKLFSNTLDPQSNYNTIILKLMYIFSFFKYIWSFFLVWFQWLSVVTSAADSSRLSSWIFCCCWTRSSWMETRVCCSWFTARTGVKTLKCFMLQNPTFSFRTRYQELMGLNFSHWTKLSS